MTDTLETVKCPACGKEMEKIELTVEALEAPIRADRYIAEHTDISRSRLKGECVS